jgi:hypothetical protein
VTALCVEQSEEWLSGRRYLDMVPVVSEAPSGSPAASRPLAAVDAR